MYDATFNPDAPAVPGDAVRGHVLVVDDSSEDLQYLVRVLREREYVPHAATDARLALAYLQKEQPDVVLLDMHLPGMDGFEMCRRLKADDRTRDIPVIFVSADHRMPDRVRAFAEGAVDYITKPFHDDEALARISAHVGLRRLAARLTEEKQRAEQASLAKSRFLANVSHELRTPLNAILGYAHILKVSSCMEPRQMRGVEAIHESGEHLMHLINDILDLARIEAGRMQLAPHPTSVFSSLRFVSHVIRVRAEAKELLFACEADELPPAVIADEKRLIQVLLNLLGNAVKFTTRGKVTLRARRLAQDERAVHVRFEVEDSGIGIAAADLETIFQPFEQVGDAEQRIGGTGLGLAISRRIVRMMGGDLLVDSTPGQGSRFWFDVCLPLARLHGVEPASSKCRRIVGYAGPRRTVLVVDDVEGSREVVAGVLGLAGFDIEQAANGREALQLLANRPVDLVVLDALMPVMDGLEAARLIRQTPGLARLPVVMISASNYENDRRLALQAGADEFLSKPLSFDCLFDTVGKLLGLEWTWSQDGKRVARPTFNPSALPR